MERYSKKDYLEAILYVGAIVILFVGLGAYILIKQSVKENMSYKRESMIMKMERLEDFRIVQQVQFKNIDSLYSKIEKFSPNYTASYQENEINILLQNYSRLYDNNSWDKRYKIFYLTGELYRMWLNDKKIYWSIKSNINGFNKNLEICQLGLRNRSNQL